MVFRTNQQPNEQFIQALQQLETMKKANRIENYGVQNSTMDDVFLRITAQEFLQSTSRDAKRILDEKCEQVFGHRELYTGIRYYLGQYQGLLIKTLLVHYRRWILTLIILSIPILYNLLSNVASRRRNADGTYQMTINALNPQAILYNSDPVMERFVRASVDGARLNQVSGNISAINEQIWGESFRLRTQLEIFIF